MVPKLSQPRSPGAQPRSVILADTLSAALDTQFPPKSEAITTGWVEKAAPATKPDGGMMIFALALGPTFTCTSSRMLYPSPTAV